MKRSAFIFAGLALLSLAGCGNKSTTGIPGTVATVNGKSIDSDLYVQDLNRRAGRPVLKNLIQQTVLLEWADEAKVPVTDSQIDAQIRTLKKSGEYDRQVKAQGEEGVRSDLRVVQAQVNLAKKYSKITDKELEMAYQFSKPNYVHGPRKVIALIINPDKAQVEKAREELKKGEDVDTVGSKYMNGRGPITTPVDEKAPGMPPALASAVKKTDNGGVSDVFSFGGPGQPSYAVLKVTKIQPKENLKLKDVKPELETSLAMQKWQTDPTLQQKLIDKLKSAKIEINIDRYKDVAKEIKNPTQQPQGPMPGQPGQP